MVRLKDIANYLNLSVTTVSYSLNNDSRIPESTRLKVINAAAELGYKGKSGQSHSSDKYMRQVVLCLNGVKGEIFTEIIDSMQKTLNLHNCELLLYSGRNISKLKWLDGVVVLNSRITNAELETITARRIPVVLMDREEHVNNAVHVILDNFNGCRETTLNAINAGAKTFAFIGGPRESYESQKRYEGFCAALAESKLDSIELVLQTDFTFEGGLNACRFLLERDNLPDAIICGNDETAMGIIEGLKQGKALKHVIITGFDGTTPSEPIRYVTAKADHKHWGTTAAYSMIQLFEHAPSVQDIKLPVSLIEYNT